MRPESTVRTSVARWNAAGLALALAASFVGCPSLSNIEVAEDGGARDVSVEEAMIEAADGRHADVRGDVACTADASSDPRNCGACGHDCGGGACLDGACQAYAILTGIDAPFGVATSSGAVYFTAADGAVRMCQATDCSNHLRMMTSGQNGPTGITTDTTNVYWTSEGFTMEGGMSGGIATCGLAGCTDGMATTLAMNEFGAMDLAVDSTSVYWSESFGGVFYSCPLVGCGGPPKKLASLGTELSGASVDATSVYFVEPQVGNVIQCPLDGCVGTPTPFASAQTKPQEVDVVGGMVYWSTSDAVMTCPTSGCVGAPTVFAASQTSPTAITHDASTLYWTLDGAAGKIMSCPLSVAGAPCKTPTTMAAMQDFPKRVAVDSSAVYWTNLGDGKLMRVVK